MPITTIFFDLDDTLYPASSGLWAAIRERITLYMYERLNIPWPEIPAMRERLFRTYGTTLRGLEANYTVDKLDYLAYVHDVPVRDYLKPDPAQRAVISALPTRKLILTNADSAHARRVLSALDLEDCFDGIVDVVTVHPYCKPQPEALTIALEKAGEPDPRRCALIDDLRHTTRAARDFGFYSLLYGDGAPGEDADAAFTSWSDLPDLLSDRFSGNLRDGD
jgi:pyrimidine 5'-nucleotidase